MNTKSRFGLAYRLQVQARSVQSSVEKGPFIKIHRVIDPFVKFVFLLDFQLGCLQFQPDAAHTNYVEILTRALLC